MPKGMSGLSEDVLGSRISWLPVALPDFELCTDHGGPRQKHLIELFCPPHLQLQTSFNFLLHFHPLTTDLYVAIEGDNIVNTAFATTNYTHDSVHLLVTTIQTHNHHDGSAKYTNLQVGSCW